MSELKLGEDTVVLAKPTPFKATEALGLIAEISEQSPEIFDRVAQFERRYEEENARRLAREVVERERPDIAKEISEEEWERMGGVLVLRRPPSTEEKVAAVAPYVYRIAKDKIIDLLALLICPSSELEKADEEGLSLYGREGALKEHRRKLLHHAELNQLLEVLIACGALIRDEIQDVGERGGVGKMLEAFGLTQRIQQRKDSASEPASSTDSPAPITGPAETPSTESPGPSSSPSLAS